MTGRPGTSLTARYIINELPLGRPRSLPQQQVHSTDTHGVSLINFALGFLLDVDFQPRIEGFHKCKLHGIADMPILQQLDYTVQADKNIDTALIEEQWGNIQRFVVSLKLQHVLPSTLLKRLNRTGDPVLRPSSPGSIRPWWSWAKWYALFFCSTT